MAGSPFQFIFKDDISGSHSGLAYLLERRKVTHYITSDRRAAHRTAISHVHVIISPAITARYVDRGIQTWERLLSTLIFIYDPCIMDIFVMSVYTHLHMAVLIIVVQNDLYKDIACMFNICYHLDVFQVFYN